AGGRDGNDYYISGTVKDEQGVIKNTGYQQYSIRANVNLNITDHVAAGLMISPNYSKRRVYYGGLQNLIKMPPFLSPEKQEDGSYLKPRDYWGSTVSGGVNPLATLEGAHLYTTSFNNVGEAYASIRFLEDFQLRSSFGFNMSYSTVENFIESRAVSSNVTSGNASDGRVFNWINENVLSYNRTFLDIHDFSAIAGVSYQYNLSRSASLTAESGSFANETIWTLNNAIVLPGSYTSKSQWGLSSYFMRVNYGYMEKYLLSASIRTDGSSRFGPENRWGYFPSASMAWRLSQEDFLINSTTVSELKLRASYGAVGNFNIGDFQYLGSIGSANYSPDGELVQGQAQASFGNPGLKWEKTESYDIGVDLGLWDNRIQLTADYYDKKTNDLLYNVSIPSLSGFTNTIVNVGDIRNSGVELELTSRNLTGQFNWTTSFNVSHNKNEMVSIGGKKDRLNKTINRGMGCIQEVRQHMLSYYAYEMEVFLQIQEALDKYPILPDQRLGTVRYEDLDGDGTITPD